MPTPFPNVFFRAGGKPKGHACREAWARGVRMACRNKRLMGAEHMAKSTWHEFVALLAAGHTPDAIMGMADASWDVKMLCRSVKLGTAYIPGDRCIRDKMKAEASATSVFFTAMNFWWTSGWSCMNASTSKALLSSLR